MADATTVATAGAAAAGLTFFGVSTGLDPAVLIAGLAGGVWAQSYASPAPMWQRLLLALLASIIAGYLAPALVLVFTNGNNSPGISPAVFQLPAAVVVGLTAHKTLGPLIMRTVGKRAETLTK